MITQWNDAEDDALQGLPLRTQIIYLRGLRRYMNYQTGIVGGNERKISLKMLGEIAEEFINRQPMQPTTKAVRVSLEQLKSAGLIERIGDDEQLVFFLKLASMDKSDPKNKGRDQGRTRAGLGQDKGTHHGTDETSNDAGFKDNHGRDLNGEVIHSHLTTAGTRAHIRDIPDTGYRIVEVVSNLEVVGDEKTKTPKKARAAPPALPDWLNHEAWSLFEQHRKKKRKPLDELSRPLLLNKLRTLTQDQQRQVIEYSISAGYPDLYPDCLNKPQADKNERECARHKAIWSTDF